MRTFISIIVIISAVVITPSFIFNAHAQGYGLTPPGPQPYQYQPYAQHLNNPSVGENPNAETGEGFGFLGLGWISIKVIGFFLFVVNYIIGLIGSVVFTLAGLFVEIGLYFNTTIMDTFVVQLGWRIMRDLANLGFTIGIVVIAYATILGIEEYNIKKSLFSLVIAAVIVNFSFPVAGVFIDASNLVTHFFVSRSIGGTGKDMPIPNPLGGEISVDGWTNSGPHQLALSLASAFGPQRLLVVNEKDFTDFEALQGEVGIITMVVATFFIALFTLIASLGMLAVSVTMLYRFVVLSGLIILMPPAVLAWAFRDSKIGKTYWGRWWDEFSCQLIYLPTIMFFIYLSIMFVTIQGSLVSSGQLSIAELSSVVEQSSSGGTAAKALSLMEKPLQVISEMILLLALLFYGIIKSRDFSCAAGHYCIGKVEGIKNWLLGAQKTKYEGAGAREWATRKTLTMGSEPDKNLGNRLANFAAKIPFAGGVVDTLRKYSTVASTTIEGYAKEYGAYTKQQRLSKARNPEILLDSEKMAGMAKAIAQAGDFDEKDPRGGMSTKEFRKFIPYVKKHGVEKEILKTSPHLYADFGMNTQQLATFMNKNFKPDDMDKISAEALSDPAVVLNLNAAHLKKIKDPSKKAHRVNLIKTINALPTDDWTAFTTNNFTDKKDIDDIHEDFLSQQRFVLGLKAAHADRIRDNAEFKQQAALVKTLSEGYDDSLITNKKPINDLAKPLIDKKSTIEWAGIMDNPNTRALFDKIEAEYRGQAAGGGAGPHTAPPANNPPQPPPAPTQANRSPNIP